MNLEKMAERYRNDDLRHDEEREEIVWLFRILLDSLSENLSGKISEIDRFILDNRKK